MPEGQVLEFSGLSKRFGTVDAVTDFTTTVRPGEVTGFLGPNGAGKTTTLRMLLGLARPTAGSATIGGRRYADLGHPARTVGAVLEANTFHPGRSAENHLKVYAQAGEIPLSRVPAVLELVGLTPVAGRNVRGFSLGMRQRLALATAMLGDPGVLVLDEPTNGLDPEGILWMRSLLCGFAEEGRTVFVSSHMLSEVQQIADSLVMIANGRLVFQGGFDALLDGAEDATIIDSPDRPALTGALTAAGLPFQVLRSGITLHGVSTAEVGAVAAAAGVALSSLQRKGPSIEEAFFELTEGRRVHPSAHGIAPASPVADLAPAATPAVEEAPAATNADDADAPTAAAAADDEPNARADAPVERAPTGPIIPATPILVPGVATAAGGLVVAAAALRTPAPIDQVSDGEPAADDPAPDTADPTAGLDLEDEARARAAAAAPPTELLTTVTLESEDSQEPEGTPEDADDAATQLLPTVGDAVSTAEDEAPASAGAWWKPADIAAPTPDPTAAAEPAPAREWWQPAEMRFPLSGEQAPAADDATAAESEAAEPSIPTDEQTPADGSTAAEERTASDEPMPPDEDAHTDEQTTIGEQAPRADEDVLTDEQPPSDEDAHADHAAVTADDPLGAPNDEAPGDDSVPVDGAAVTPDLPPLDIGATFAHAEPAPDSGAAPAEDSAGAPAPWWLGGGPSEPTGPTTVTAPPVPAEVESAPAAETTAPPVAFDPPADPPGAPAIFRAPAEPREQSAPAEEAESDAVFEVATTGEIAVVRTGAIPVIQTAVLPVIPPEDEDTHVRPSFDDLLSGSSSPGAAESDIGAADAPTAEPEREPEPVSESHGAAGGVFEAAEPEAPSTDSGIVTHEISWADGVMTTREATATPDVDAQTPEHEAPSHPEEHVEAPVPDSPVVDDPRADDANDGDDEDAADAFFREVGLLDDDNDSDEGQHA